MYLLLASLLLLSFIGYALIFLDSKKIIKHLLYCSGTTLHNHKRILIVPRKAASKYHNAVSLKILPDIENKEKINIFSHVRY